jgi:hypothetical protein
MEVWVNPLPLLIGRYVVVGSDACKFGGIVSSVPINDFAIANVELATMETEKYYSCCGKIMCTGCVHSSYMSGNDIRFAMQIKWAKHVMSRLKII